MKLHEHQGKELLRKAGVPVPIGRVAFSAAEAEEAARAILAETKDETVVVKAQIHAGGRGKGGGVKVVHGVAEARAAAEKILGMTLVTHQTGPEGKVVRRLLVEQGLKIRKELYASVVVDRERRRVVLMLSSEGGMEIEEVARKSPDKIHSRAIDPAYGMRGFEARDLAYALGLGEPATGKLARVLQSLYRVFVAEDCSLVEVNPLVVLESGDVLALDAKVVLDDNGAFRHKDREGLADPAEEDPAEAAARAAGFSYVRMHGNVGCMVNGAGLAMATMDILKHHGGDPANFLDVGGSSNPAKVINAFRIILHNPRVKVVFINIFGGITRCDDVARGLLETLGQYRVAVPIVVRLAGTNDAEGRALLSGNGSDLGTRLIVAATLEEGAEKAVEIAKQS